MASDAVIAVAVIFSSLGLLLIIFIFVNLVCLWQAKKQPSSTDVENGLKENCLKAHQYQVRSYIGCLPRFKGPLRHWTKKYEYSIRQCWFRLCCICCQELHENETYLDEVFIPPAVIIAPASSKLEKRPSTLPVMSMYGNTTDSMGPNLEVPQMPSPRRGSMPKMSILAPDPIVVSLDRYTPTHRQSMIQEDTEPVDFYAYQLEGKAGERMLY